jgi:cobalt-zinc-cadmium efflux system membrane fusion protein
MVGEPKALGVTAQAYEADVAQIKPGAEVTVSLPQLTRDVRGQVRTIGAELDKETRRVPVFITLQEAVPALRPGMLAKVEASGQAQQREMVIPVTAVLIKDGTRSIVFVQRDKQVFEAKDVRLGQPVRGVVPVLGGLSPSDRIVVRGGLLLDGAASQLM